MNDIHFGINSFWQVAGSVFNVCTGYNIQDLINNMAEKRWSYEVATGGSDFNYNCTEQYREEIITLAKTNGLPNEDIKIYLEEPVLVTPPYVDNYWA